MGRIRQFLHRHKHAEEVAAESLGISLATRLIIQAFFVAGTAAAATTVALSTQPARVYHPPYGLSVKGAAFLTRNEGVRLQPYNDPYNCTVGVGHLIHTGYCKAYDYAYWHLTLPQAVALLQRDVTRYANYVREFTTQRITQYQFDSLVDLTYNIGGGGYEFSRLRSDLNAGRVLALVRDFYAYSYASGHYLPGLHARRSLEIALFYTGNYGQGIGRWLPPKPLTAAQKRTLSLRAKTGYFAWLAWYQGYKPWKVFGPQNSKVRPHVSKRIPTHWWIRRRVFLRARMSH